MSERKGLVTKRCRKCIFSKKFSAGRDEVYCDFNCMMGKSRRCPAGDDCIEFRPRRIRRGDTNG